jgi:hypothetical protein
MGLWEKMKNGVQGNDGVVMDYPHHIRRAFAWVGVSENPYGYEEKTPEEQATFEEKSLEDLIRENVQRFVQRWGGVEEAALLRALDEDRGIDRLKAIFAIGYSPFPHALDLIAPYLASANRIERCAAACVMGVHHDERAIAVLKEYYLHDDVDASGKLIPEAEYWYQNYYAVLALVLANWGPEDLTDVLRRALLRMNSLEYPPSIGYTQNEITPSNLFYALGRRGLFSILDEVQLSNRGRAMALFSLAAGYLNAYERHDLLFWALMEDEGLSTDLTNVWKEQIGVSDQEIQKCFATLEELWQTLFQLVWWTKYED